MAGIEQLQQQLEELTTAITKLNDQVKGLEHIGSLTRSSPLDSKGSVPARESGYVNWDESHDSLKNSGYMKWLSVQTLLDANQPQPDFKKLQESSITINENFRFPEEKNSEINIYVNVSNPEVICEVLNFHYGRTMSELIASVKNHTHTRTSFEEKYKLRWVDTKEQTPHKETEFKIIKNEESATQPPVSSETTEVGQNIADNEKDQQILGKVISNNVDTLTEHENMPSIEYGENSNSNQNFRSSPEMPKVCYSTQKILADENLAPVDIMSIESTSGQKLLDTADVLTQNMDDDLIVPLNSIHDSLFKQDSSMDSTAPKDEGNGAKEDLSENKITTESKHEDEEENKILELLEILPEMLDIITQSKCNDLITELSALDLSHKEPLNIVVELFVDNYSDIMEELIKKKVNIFLREVKTLQITTKAHFIILLDLLCEKIAEEPELAHHFAYMCHELSDNKEFHSLLLHKCKNDFETFVIKNNQMIDKEGDQINKRCLGIVRFIGELYNIDMLTSTILDYCLRTLIEKCNEINLECVCELLNISGKKIGLKNSTELSKALKKIAELLSSDSNADICCRVKKIMQKTLNLSQRKWKTIPLPMTLDRIEKKGDRKRRLMNMLHGSEIEDRENTRIDSAARLDEDRVALKREITLDLSQRKRKTIPLSITFDQMEKIGDRKRLLMNILNDSETENRENTRIGSAAWFDEGRVAIKPEKIVLNPSRTKYSVETLKMAVTGENISYLNQPPTFFENIYENYSILEKFTADPTTHNERILSYQETIMSKVDSEDSITLIQEDLTQDQNKIVRHSIQTFIENSDAEKLALNIESQIPRRYHGALMGFILDEALTSAHNKILSDAMFLLVETNIVTLEIFKASIKDIFFTIQILYKHIPFPDLYEKLACILAPHIENHNITLVDIFAMSNNIIIVGEGHHFLGTLLHTLQERRGKAFVKTLWDESKLSPVQWMFTDMVQKWVADYKLVYMDIY